MRNLEHYYYDNLIFSPIVSVFILRFSFLRLKVDELLLVPCSVLLPLILGFLDLWNLKMKRQL